MSKLQEATLKVMGAVLYIQKQSSPGLSYKFASESALIQALRPAMVEHGITVSVAVRPEFSTREYETSRGAKMIEFVGTVCFRFTCEGEYEDHWVLAQAADSGDKAAGKWMTSAQKYALRQFFLIETGDDPDEFVHERNEANSEAVTKALSAINSAKTLDDLSSLESRFINAVDKTFSPNQVARLQNTLETRKARLRMDGKKKGGDK